MNDPGLDKPISSGAKKVEKGKEYDSEQDDDLEEDQTFMDPR